MEKEQKIGSRINILDAMRGYFILWIGIYNTLNILNTIYPNLYYSSILLLINDKGWFCLSVIFGFGCGLLFKNKKDGESLFFKRMLVLFILSLCNSLLYYGDILKDYALMGMLIYLLRKILIQHKNLSLGVVLILTLLSICFMDNDMRKMGNLSNFIHSGNVFISNFKYSIYLNIHSQYYLIVYHLEMLLLVMLGFYASNFGIKSSYLWIFERAVLNFRLYLGLDILTLLLFIFTSSISWLNHLMYFTHILLFSLWYMTGFYLLIKPETWLHSFLSSIGRKTLSIYLCQNTILCSFWFLSPITLAYGLLVNTLIFVGLQVVLLGIFVLSTNRINTGRIESFWRKLARLF